MKIALVRGDFAAPSEFVNFKPLLEKNEITIFTGRIPVWNLEKINGFKIIKLFSPVDLNFGKVSRMRMAILNRLFTDAHLLLGLEEKLKGYDIAHSAETYFRFTQQCINAKEKGFVKKVVSSVWENIPHNNEGIRGRKAYKTKAFEKIDLFLAITQGAKTALVKEGCSPAKILVLKPGIDLNVFKPSSLKNNEKEIILLFVGRLVEEKGVLEIVEMFKGLLREFPNIKLNISGTGPLYRTIDEQIKNRKLKSVELLGNVAFDQMPNVYRNSDIFVHYPIGSRTWVEQYGMVLVEALASGLAVLALDKGSIREVLGTGGVITDEKNFKTQLKRIIQDRSLRDKLKKKSRKYARDNYDSKDYAAKIEKIYNNLLRNK